MNILNVDSLEIGYNKNTIGKPFTFSLENGKLYTLIGKNGTGKSTLIKTLSRLIEPLKGSIVMNNQSLYKLSNEAFSKLISFVFTNQPIDKNLTIHELISLGRHPYTNWMHSLSSYDLDIINEAITITDLIHLQNKKLNQVSDGQLQRALIARALAQNTPIILLDEPSSHLDLFHKVQLFKMLRNLCDKKNKCILFSCHDLDLAMQLSDKMLVIKENENFFNTPDHLIDNDVFNHFFNDEDIVFNKEQKRFIIK